MKRFRVRLAGFGFVALAGSAVAGDRNWLAIEPPAQRSPATAIPTKGDAGIVPSSVRLAAASEPATTPDPIWLPAAKMPPAVLPDMPPSVRRPVVEQVQPAASQVPTPGSRVGIVPNEPARETPEYLPPPTLLVPSGPVNEPPAPIPGVPAEIWRGYQANQPKPATSDSPVQPARPMTPPILPDALPAPRPVGPQPTVTELPVAPPALMVPDCTPGKYGSFGSPPIRLSRDYPPLSELCGTPVRDWFVSRFAGDREAGSGGFLQGEYLLWWMPGLRIPVLATTNPNPNSFGFLGEPGTVPILGPGTMIGSTRQGFRVRGGLWLDDCCSCGIDGSIFVLGRRTADASFSSSQFGLITRPVFSPNIQPGIGFIGETGEAVTVPGVLTGGLTAHAESFLWGADANIRHCLNSGCDWKLMGFAGYRFLSLSEKLSVQENILVTGASPRVAVPDPIGTTIVVRDTFETHNRFNGGQIGATYERRRGRWDLDTRASIAFGVTSQELDIDGFQTRTRPGGVPATFRGGLLAAGPNLGHFTRDRFSVVPEATVNVGYWLTPNLKAFVGYNFIYWTNVIRPGDQIDRTVDLSFVPNAPPTAPSGQLRPQPLFRQSDLWVTGIQFGAEWRW
jgi:hypothetical protein